MHRYYTSLFKALQGYTQFIWLPKQAHISVWSEQQQCHGTIAVISNTLQSHHQRATCAKDRAITQGTAHKFSSSCSVVQESKRQKKNYNSVVAWTTIVPSSGSVKPKTETEKRPPLFSGGGGCLSPTGLLECEQW